MLALLTTSLSRSYLFRKMFETVEMILDRHHTGTVSTVALFCIGRSIQALRHVDLQILSSSKDEWEVDEKVVLNLRTRNIDTIVVKTFEIDTWNFCCAHETMVDISVDLEGLSAMTVENFEMNNSSAMNHCDWAYESLIQRRGVFVIEFLGGGRTCRALIRKGGVRAFQRVCSAGHAFKLLYEDSSEIKDAQIRMGGQAFEVLPSDHDST